MELGFCNYNIYRNDRDFSIGKKRGGGVLVAVHNKIQCEMLRVPMVPDIEQIFIKIKINNINIILGCIYIPPNATNDMYSSDCEVVETIYANFPDFNFVMVGYFNLSNFDWSTDPASQNHISGNIIFNSNIHFLNLKQKNNVKNKNDRTLDCIMINDNIEVISLNHSLESLVPKVDYHHPPLDIFLKFTNTKFNSTSECPIIYNFNRCNFNEIVNFLSNIDFDSYLNNNNISF